MSEIDMKDAHDQVVSEGQPQPDSTSGEQQPISADQAQEEIIRNETFCIGKYQVVTTDDSEAPQRTWKNTEIVEDFSAIFIEHEFSGDVDWSEDGVYLAAPDNAEMIITFQVPKQLLNETQEAINYQILVGLSWLSQSEDSQFDVLINDRVIEGRQIRISTAGQESQESSSYYSVSFYKDQLLHDEVNNKLKVIVKGGQSPLLVSSMQMRIDAPSEAIDQIEVLKNLRSTNAAIISEEVEEDQPAVINEEEGGSIFDQKEQSVNNNTSSADQQKKDGGDESQAEIASKPTSSLAAEQQDAEIRAMQEQSALQETINQANMQTFSDDEEDAMQNKREVDQDIAQELRQQEDSYTEQIASLHIENTKISQREEQETDNTQGQNQTNQSEDQTAIEPQQDTAELDSDEEFRMMDERIAAQVMIEKRKQQINNGAKLTKICSQIGRCPICTLKPPCNHRKVVDHNIHPDLLAMSPAQAKKGLSVNNTNGSPRDKHQVSNLVQQFPFATSKRNEGLHQSIDSFGGKQSSPAKQKKTPYSILAGNSQEEWDAQKSHLESMMGSKTTRANVMAQLHVKKKFQGHLEAGRIQKMMNRQELEAQRALARGEQQQNTQNISQLQAEDSILVDQQQVNGDADPLMDPSTFNQMNTSRTAAAGAQRRHHENNLKMRQRDRRGVYQSIEIKRNRSPEAQEEYELRKAEERLRTIEMISKYREDKIKAEFRKLESDLKAQDMKNAMEKQRSKEKRGYYQRQKQATNALHNSYRKGSNDSPGGRENADQDQEYIKAQAKEQSRQRYLEDQKRKLVDFRNLENADQNNNQEMSNAGQSERDKYMTEDPMRVRGSFYLAKPGGPSQGFSMQQSTHQTKPRGSRQKDHSIDRILKPKKKAKLKLAPLAPRQYALNKDQNQFPTSDEFDNRPEANSAQQPVRMSQEKVSERGSMRNLDNHARAQRIYLSHVQQRLGNDSKKSNQNSNKQHSSRQESKSNLTMQMQAYSHGSKARIKVKDPVGRSSPNLEAISRLTNKNQQENTVDGVQEFSLPQSLIKDSNQLALQQNEQ